MKYAKSGRTGVTVVCPGFATDCLETLEEIAFRNRALFLENGGVSYDYVPALNASEANVELIAAWLSVTCRTGPRPPLIHQSRMKHGHEP